MRTETNRRAEKIRHFRTLAKGKRLCRICLERSSGKSMFARARKGTC